MNASITDKLTQAYVPANFGINYAETTSSDLVRDKAAFRCDMEALVEYHAYETRGRTWTPFLT